jgi:phage-related protein
MKQTVIIDKRADKEISVLPINVQIQLRSLIGVLADTGKLNLPEGKKLNREIFEIRIKSKNQHRCLYAYCNHQIIVILSAFTKKQQKTPLKEIEKAFNRLKTYK